MATSTPVKLWMYTVFLLLIQNILVVSGMLLLGMYSDPLTYVALQIFAATIATFCTLGMYFKHHHDFMGEHHYRKITHPAGLASSALVATFIMLLFANIHQLANVATWIVILLAMGFAWFSVSVGMWVGKILFISLMKKSDPLNEAMRRL